MYYQCTLYSQFIGHIIVHTPANPRPAVSVCLSAPPSVVFSAVFTPRQIQLWTWHSHSPPAQPPHPRTRAPGSHFRILVVYWVVGGYFISAGKYLTPSAVAAVQTFERWHDDRFTFQLRLCLNTDLCCVVCVNTLYCSPRCVSSLQTWPRVVMRFN